MKYLNIKNFAVLISCYLIWGFQPLYFQLFDGMNTVFLLFQRIIWASILSIALIAYLHKMPDYIAMFKNRKIFFRELIATVLLFGDWAVYLWAVQNGKIMECSLGYYIQPIVMFTFGAVIFHEKISIKYIGVLFLIIVGIILSVRGFEGFPIISISLAFMFAIYSAFKKGLQLDPVVSSAFEITMMVPLIAVMSCFSFKGNFPFTQYLSIRDTLLFIGAGFVTATPIYLFSYAIKNVPLITNAFCEYLSPTINLICGIITGEAVSYQKLFSFAFIWVALILYTLFRISELKRSNSKVS